MMKTVKVTTTKTIWQKTKGLIGKNHPYPVLIQTRFGIHTFGVKFPLDIIILNDNQVIKAMKEHLRSNQLYFWNPKYDQVIELPSGMIKKKKLKKGEKIKIEKI